MGAADPGPERAHRGDSGAEGMQGPVPDGLPMQAQGSSWPQSPGGACGPLFRDARGLGMGTTDGGARGPGENPRPLGTLRKKPPPPIPHGAKGWTVCASGQGCGGRSWTEGCRFPGSKQIPCFSPSVLPVFLSRSPRKGRELTLTS